MTVTILKTKFVKTDPTQINYGDYKKFNISSFNEDLRNEINSDVTSSSNYNRFQNIVREVLDNHAPLKKRANNSAFMTKSWLRCREGIPLLANKKTTLYFPTTENLIADN